MKQNSAGGTLRSLRNYFIVLFVLSYSWQWLIYLTGGVESFLFPFLMLFPGIVAIAFCIKRRESLRNVGWGLARWWYILPVAIVPLVITLGVGLVVTGLNLASWSGAHFIIRDGMVDIQGVPMVLGSHSQSIAFFALNLTVSLLAQSVIGSVATFGEELGWRGYAQGKLIRAFGINRGLVLLGVVWGYWHLPIILMGYNFPNHPVLGAFVLMPISTTFMGVFLGWLYLRSRSIWIPTLAHASMNLSAMLLFTEVTMLHDELFRQAAFMAAWGVVAALCLLSLNRRPAFRPAALQQETT
jgi:membrane protease YdiL (CAAX protease family)